MLHAAMLWIDRIEKVGRLLLWLTLASAVVLVPITYVKQRSAEAQLAETLRKEEQALARKAKEAAEKKPDRLTFKSMGPAMHVLDTSRAKGMVWFSNVSARSGFVCVKGIATNPTTQATTSSLATCKAIEQYASNVEIPLMFAGASVEEICRGGNCRLTIEEAEEAK